MSVAEQAVDFVCEGDQLFGVLGLPPIQVGVSKGVLIIVGGPQTRTGSHRQFTLLARELAERGTPVFRFDYRGMGDSAGVQRDFTKIQEDVRAAVDAFFRHVPALQEVVLWGLCDAASAAAFYAASDARVCGVVLINPWVRTEEGLAKAYLKHYYLRRLFEPSFWQKILQGKLGIGSGLRSLGSQVRKVNAAASTPVSDSLPERMLAGLRQFNGAVLVILCGNDLTAQEFASLLYSAPAWVDWRQTSGVSVYNLPGANHTFSQQTWRAQILGWTDEWLKLPKPLRD